MTSGSLAEIYRSKCKTAEEAIKLIRPGQRVFIGSGCGEPQHLVNALMDRAKVFSDVEIVRLLSLEGSLLALMAAETQGRNLNVRSIYQGSGQTKSLLANQRYITPMNLSSAPGLFTHRHLPLHVALVQVSPPDKHGWLNLGISVDITLAAAQSADTVIAQVNPQMPRVQGHGFIHVNDVDVLVEHDEELLSIYELPDHPSAPEIAKLTADLVRNGATIQLGLGVLARAIGQGLSQKNDLGIHTQYMTREIMELARQGVVTNRMKGLNEGKMLASAAIGDNLLYTFLNNNPAIEFRGSEYVNHPAVISRHRHMTAINMARTMDLTGQVGADALPQNHFSGVTGMLDFITGASMSQQGRSIMVIPATINNGKSSRIISQLDVGAVVIPRSYVSYVVSEFGAVNLFGKNNQERAMAMISLAHPDFREELFHQAQENGLIDRHRTLSESLFGVYPVRMEETIDLKGHAVTFRPAKPVDDRRIQEHFYHMDSKDVTSRFFSFRKSFNRDDVKNMFQIDYIKNFSIVAVIGEFGFGNIIGIGTYYLEHGTVAEVAFSVSKEWQGKGIAGIILKKLVEAARENGITRLVAYVLPTNRGMINLFKKLPYKIKTVFEEDALVLSCDFEPLN